MPSFFFECYGDHRDLHSFPTRRSSDLVQISRWPHHDPDGGAERRAFGHGDGAVADRKSTRLNSSHTVISYAVFCLKKKKKTNTIQERTQKGEPTSDEYVHTEYERGPAA